MNEENIRIVKSTDGESATAFDDHGQTWIRKAGREHTKVSGHALVVFPADGDRTLIVEGAPPGGGFGFFIVDDATTEMVATGSAPTRAEARRHAVITLGNLLGVDVVPPPKLLEAPTFEGEHRRIPQWMLVAAGAIVVFAFASAVGVIVAAVVNGAR